MKKFLPYILIVIILVVFFSPTVKVSAQATTVGCTLEGVSVDYDEAKCKAQGGQWTSGTAAPTPYVLLAPLPGLDENFNPEEPTALGKYLNTMITVIIGLAAVMAVVMIVMGGIEYMTSELVHSKEAGKEKIRGALLGLLIALGAYALLYTINPDLLDTGLESLAPVTVEVDFEDEFDSGPPSLTAYSGALPSSAPNCPGGVTRSPANGIVACNSISSNIDQLVAAAKQSGLTIWAGGFRTSERQTELRKQNCNGDTTNPKAVCRPPTARPGYSRHQSGLAFDMTCNGTTIQAKDNACFRWLQTNAAKYGLANLPSEPWHWSVDGR